MNSNRIYVVYSDSIDQASTTFDDIVRIFKSKKDAQDLIDHLNEQNEGFESYHIKSYPVY